MTVMKLLNLTFIFYIFLIRVLAIFRVPKEVNIKDYIIANTKINYIESKNSHMSIRRFFNVNIASETYTIVIKPNAITYLYDKSTEVVILSKNLTLKRNISEYSSCIVNGYVEGFIGSSSVEGYLQNDEYYGTIVFGNKSYYVANINRFQDIADLYKNKIELNAVVYDQDSILYSNHTNWFKRSIVLSHLSQRNDEEIFREFIAERHICSLYLQLDNSFITIIHNNNIAAAVAQVMLSVREVNSLFRSTDFDEDGIPDDLGFVIKYLVVLESDESPQNYMPTYSTQPVNPRNYLAHFTQYAILEEVCLGVLFTAQSFRENVLGISYSAVSESDVSNDIIGGICQRPFAYSMFSLNVAAVSYISTKGVRLGQNTLDTCLAHELGHAFGCRHDQKSDPGYHNDYLMSSHTLPGISANNFQFSPISKKHLVMTVPRKGQCLTDSKESFCGNGILENGEECDCGAKYICQSKDPCCIHNGQLGACQINRASGFQCHPSQGLCCSSECKYKHLESIGVDCQLISKKCPCDQSHEDCQCGLGGRCLGSKCHSEECARIDARECDCPTPSEVKSCNICCRDDPGGPCLPSKILTKMKLDTGSITTKQLRKFNTIRILPNMTEFENFCHETECAILAFKTSDLGDYCLHWGQLGICTSSGCNVKEKDPFGKDAITKNLKSISWFIFCNKYLVYCFILALVI